MKKKWVASTLGILGIVLLSYFGILKYFREAPSSKKGNKYYFSEIPITKWTEGQFPTPCLPIRIGAKTICSMLDLGFRGHFSISEEILDQIEEKKYLGSKKMYGFGGKTYEKKVFEIPEVQLGALFIHRSSIQVEAKEFNSNGTLIKDGEKIAHDEPGRIGWEIFQLANLFLDLGNKTLALCDSLGTLKKQGYAVESFSKTPLISERGFIEIDAKTSIGKLRCVLDTGCTFNVLNSGNNQSKDELIWNPEKYEEIPLFTIADKEFGPVIFHQLPIELPIQVEAFLGMEFFKDNLVFLDFSNNLVYFAPCIKNLSSVPDDL